MKNILAIGLLLFAVTGCATVKGALKTITQNDVLVEAAVAHYLDANKSQAREINRVTSLTLELIKGPLGNGSNDTITLGNLKSYFESNIQVSGMLPEDQAILHGMINSVADEWLKGLLANGVTNPSDQLIKTQEFLQWLQTASARYVKG